MNEFVNRLNKLAEDVEDKEKEVKQALGQDLEERLFKILLPIEKQKVEYLKKEKESWESDNHYEEFNELLESKNINADDLSSMDWEDLGSAIKIELDENLLKKKISAFLSKVNKI